MLWEMMGPRMGNNLSENLKEACRVLLMHHIEHQVVEVQSFCLCTDNMAIDTPRVIGYTMLKGTWLWCMNQGDGWTFKVACSHVLYQPKGRMGNQGEGNIHACLFGKDCPTFRYPSGDILGIYKEANHFKGSGQMTSK